MKSWRVLLDISGLQGADLERWNNDPISDTDIRVAEGADSRGETWVVRAGRQSWAMGKVHREIKAGGFGALVKINEIEER